MSEAEEIVRRIKTAMAWRKIKVGELAKTLSMGQGELSAHFGLKGRRADPMTWGSRGGPLSLDTLARVFEVPTEALHAGGPRGPLVGLEAESPQEPA